MKSFLFATVLSAVALAALCMPHQQQQQQQQQQPSKDLSTQAPQVAPVTNGELPALLETSDKEVRPPLKHKEGSLQGASYGFINTVRKEWKCVNGQCREHITKCKNGRCDSVENSFKAEKYEPNLPSKIDPFPFPNINFDQLFASLFGSFLKFDFPSPFNFDNSGLMDVVVDDKNSEFYFTNAKFVNSKCADRTCEIKTKTCVNDKCDETVTTRSF